MLPIPCRVKIAFRRLSLCSYDFHILYEVFECGQDNHIDFASGDDGDAVSMLIITIIINHAHAHAHDADFDVCPPL